MTGRVWVFGDDINTDVLAPGQYMKGPIEQLAGHCLEAINPEFAKSVERGDILVAGTNFGVGSSREQAPQALKLLGIKAVVAKSFAGIFYRNALNLGLPVLVPENSDAISSLKNGDKLAANIKSAVLTIPGSGNIIQCEPLPEFLFDLVKDGGLVPHLEKRFSAQKVKQ